METTDLREWHYLRPLKSTQVPANIAFVDCETYPVQDTSKAGRQRHHLRLWCASAMRLEKAGPSREQEQSGERAEDFWNFMESRTDNLRPLWLFCHNAGFDLTVLGFWQAAALGRYDFVQHQSGPKRRRKAGRLVKWCGLAVLDDPPTILKFRIANTRRTIVVVDTYNYFRCSLEEIGRSIGMAKGTMPPFTAPLEVWQDYCQQDVKVLRTAVLSLIGLVKSANLGGLPYTVSALAMTAYRKRFLPDAKAILIHGNRDALRIERESYHGGATHLWYAGYVCEQDTRTTGKPTPPDTVAAHFGPVFNLDVQSFYPYVMKMYQFPCRLKQVVNIPSRGQLDRAMASGGVIAAVWLDCGPPGYPVTRNGKTYYAQGRFMTVLPYPELARAMQAGHVKKHGQMAEYETADLFSGFVDYFYQLRREYDLSGNKAFAYVCKLLLNSLYGKWGQMRWTWQDDKETTAPVPFGNWYERRAGEVESRVYRSLGWLPQLQQGKAEHPDSFPAISSYITSYGRELILKYAQIAGIENCYYSDTDSLHVNTDGLVRLTGADCLAKGQLGKLTIKDKWAWTVYRGVKNYTTPDGDVIAGIKHDATKVRRGQYRQSRFQRLASVLAGGEMDSIAVDDVLVRVAQHYPQGNVDSDGHVQVPLLCEW